MLLRGAQQETAPPLSASIPSGTLASERSCGPRKRRGRLGRGGGEPQTLASRLPRGPHDREDAKRSQREASDLEKQENKITERVGGSQALPKRNGRKWKMGFAKAAVLCRPGGLGPRSCSTHLRAVESTFCSAATLLTGSDWRRNVFSYRKRALSCRGNDNNS